MTLHIDPFDESDDQQPDTDTTEPTDEELRTAFIGPDAPPREAEPSDDERMRRVFLGLRKR